jgi:signal transduction histidine kinase/ActR/RegA family two-component response regulator
MRANFRSLAFALLIATICTGLTVFLRFGVGDLLGQRVPLFLPMIVAVFAAAWYGGWAAGLLTTALGVVLGTLFFDGQPSPSEALNRLRVILFVVEGLAVTGSLEAMHRARRRLERKKTQLEKEVRERQHAEQELVTAARRKNEFLATLAHELRNPLAPLRNCLEIIDLNDGDPHTIQQVRPIMKRQLDQMVRLVDDLLDVARITQDKITLRKESVQLGQIIRNAVEASRPSIQASGHELSIRLSAQPVLIEADPVRLTQVFSNLLNNAAKYMDQGGHISLSAERNQGEVVVKVKDTGIGIPADELPRIFEMFTQANQSVRKSQGGLGIGLCLAKRLVVMHGGTISAHSDGPGQGSQFVVRVPVRDSLPSRETEETGFTQRVISGKKHRILVVDDNADTVFTLGTMLTKMGNEVQAANDGLQAVEAAQAWKPEVVILDIRMPKLNGYEAARRIRSQPWGKNVVLVAHTGWGQEEDRCHSEEAGFDYHLVKPVSPIALENLLAGLQTTTEPE